MSVISAMLTTRREASNGVQQGTLSPVDCEEDSRNSWKRFCREQGRIAAEMFTDRMRAFKEEHSTAMQSDTALAHEFSASMCEHLAALTSTVAEAHGDMSAPSLVSLSSTLTATSAQDATSVPTPPSRQGHKHWWQIFTRGKNKRHGGSTKRPRKSTSSTPNTDVVLDQIVSQMNLNDGWDRGKMSWTKCRLRLVKIQNNYQLEIYCPCKSPTPKTSLFCFLIEEVRSTSSLEVPDSDCCFVVKCHNHGEYVFDVSSETDKIKWMTEIVRSISYSSNTSSSPSARMTTSASMNMIGNGGVHATMRGARSQVPVQRATSPLLESYRASPMQYPRTHSQQDDDPALVDISTLNPNLPYLNPSSSSSTNAGSIRRRRAHSMYLDSVTVQSSDGRSGRQRPNPSSASPPLPRRTIASPPVPSHAFPPRDLPPLPPPFPTRPLPSPPSSPQSGEERTSISHVASSGSNEELGSPTSSSSALPLQDNTTPEGTPPRESERKSSSSSPSQVHPESTDTDNTESLSRILSSELSFSNRTPETSRRGLTRQRSLDSSVAHRAEASNNYRIDIDSMDQVGAQSDSTFSSAGNLHEVIHDHILSPSTSNPESPVTDTASETSSIPLYIETSGNGVADLQLPSFTRHPYQSWATNSTDLENLRTLSQHPWFHGLISRANATLLVLGNGHSGSGQYLVRQSESREGDFVLTFNCRNRAKHLRLTLDTSGCTIQHLWFEDIVTMLDYFKTHPISLETVAVGDEISLTTYIDRSASDTFRTTTVVNVERIQRTPPRRSRSIHVSMTHSASERGSPTHSLSSSANHSSWRHLFNRQRSSSSQSVRSHAVVQRRHSENAGSIMEVQNRARGFSGRDRSGNSYVWKNY